MIRQRAKDSGMKRIPKSPILGKQLGRMTNESLQDGQKSNLYAVNALKCLIGKFPAYPVKPQSATQMNSPGVSSHRYTVHGK